MNIREESERERERREKERKRGSAGSTELLPAEMMLLNMYRTTERRVHISCNVIIRFKKFTGNLSCINANVIIKLAGKKITDKLHEKIINTRDSSVLCARRKRNAGSRSKDLCKQNDIYNVFYVHTYIRGTCVSCNINIEHDTSIRSKRLTFVLAGIFFFLFPIMRASPLSSAALCATGKIAGSLHCCNFRVMQMICRCANPGIYARNADSLL